MWCTLDSVEVDKDDSNVRHDELWGWLHRASSKAAWHTLAGLTVAVGEEAAVLGSGKKNPLSAFMANGEYPDLAALRRFKIQVPLKFRSLRPKD